MPNPPHLLEPTLAGVFVASFVVGFSGAVMPGPLLARTITRSASHGFLAGPVMVTGHGALELALVIALTLGLGNLLVDPTVFAWIALVGGAVLIAFSVSMFRSLPKLRLDLAETGSGAEAAWPRVALDGAVTTAANPYWTLWWATVGLSYMGLSLPLGALGLAAFFVGHVASDYAWYAFVSGLVAGGRRALSDRWYRGLVGLCAVALAGFGLLFAWIGLRRFIG